jgi:hypothetical protein
MESQIPQRTKNVSTFNYGSNVHFQQRHIRIKSTPPVLTSQPSIIDIEELKLFCHELKPNVMLDLLFNLYENKNVSFVCTIVNLQLVCLHGKCGFSDDTRDKILTDNALRLVKHILAHLPEIPEKDGFVCLRNAFYTKRYDLLELLLETKRFDFTLNNNELISHAARDDDYTALSLFLEIGKADFSYLNNEILKIVCTYGFTRSLAVILRSDINPARDDNVAIKLAAIENHDDVVRVLLTHEKVNPAAEDNIVLSTAISHKNYKMIDDLMNHTLVCGFYSVEPTHPNNLPIYEALQLGDLIIINQLRKNRPLVRKYVDACGHLFMNAE